jgi:hypothetical protein
MLKIFFAVQNEVPTKAAEEVTLVSDTVADSPHKVTSKMCFSFARI